MFDKRLNPTFGRDESREPQDPRPQPHPSPTPTQQRQNPSTFFGCFNGWRFSATVDHLTKGSRINGAAQVTSQVLEIGPPISLAADAAATTIKATRTGVGGTTNRYASGLNFFFRHTANASVKGSLIKFGTKATPILSGVDSRCAGLELCGWTFTYDATGRYPGATGTVDVDIPPEPIPSWEDLPGWGGHGPGGPIMRMPMIPLHPVQQKDPCTFNINISGVSGETLTDMQNEISRIFASGGFNVVFGHPELANGGSANLTVTPQFFGAIAQSMGSDVNNPSRAGRTLGSDAQINSTNIFAAVNRSTTLVRTSSMYATYGTIYGRIGAHEAIAHALTGTPGHPVNLQRDVRNPSDPVTLSDRYNLHWNIGEATAIALRGKCP